MGPFDIPLHKAVRDGNIEDVKTLILNGAEINSMDISNNTPLDWAVFKNQILIAKLLLQNGADVNIIKDDTIFDTPLHVASGFGCLEMVEMLIRKGADIEAKDFLARTPLHLANEKTTEILIQMGAKLDAKDNRGDTPIHTATNLWNDSSKVLMLMRYGASLKIRNQDGLTPLECVLKGGSIFSSEVRMPHFKVISYNEMM